MVTRLGQQLQVGISVAVLLAAACGDKSQGPHAHTGDGEKVVVPSDPKATYFILDRAGTTERPIVTTKRIGPSGTSYTRRECDCNNRTWRYLAEGDTLEELEASPKPNEPMGPLVEGSIADVMWQHACRGHRSMNDPDG